MDILVINCGSSSLKFQLIDAVTEKRIAKGLCERIGIEGGQLVYTPASGEKIRRSYPMANHEEAVSLVLNTLTDEKIGVVKDLSEICAVGHRVVHGGEHFAHATRITEEVKAEIEECSALAPLHNPANLIGIRACEALMPGIPMVAVFDTAFHQTMPEDAFLYALPYSYYQDYKIRRYGFHGTSHSFVSHQTAQMLGRRYEDLKMIICHLGNGASVSAVKDGRCADTSMGLTPLEGLIMGTRSGDVDPAVIEFVAQKEGKTLHEVIEILNKKSGVLGLSNGFSSDFRDLEDAALAGNEDAGRALSSYVYRVSKYIGAYAAAMNGVDAIAFTAGIGENSPIIREMIFEHLGYLGIALDEEANQKRGENIEISTADSKVKVLVIPTNEELAIARETYELVKNA